MIMLVSSGIQYLDIQNWQSDKLMTMFLCGLQFVYMFSYSFRLVFGRSTNVLLVSRFHDYFFVFLFLAGHLQLGELSQSNQRLELSSTRLDETQRRLDSRLGVISKFFVIFLVS